MMFCRRVLKFSDLQNMRSYQTVMKTDLPILPILKALAISLCGGLLFKIIGIPLPWMLGPLFCVGLAGVSGVEVKSIRGGRQAGQLIIGCGLGQYFTAEVTWLLLNYGGYILAAACSAIMIGGMGGLLMKRVAGISGITAYFASVPGGAAEMAVLAERAGARFDQVALSHSIRVLVTVTVIPIAVTMTGANGSEVFHPLTTAVNPQGLLGLLLIASSAAYAFMKLRIPNAWLLGPLMVSLLLTVNGQSMSAVPQPLAVMAQLLLGCSLGARFDPGFRKGSRRLMAGVLASIAVTVCLSALMGSLMAWMMGMSGAMLVLATAPGGLAEMCITAKILRLGVPLVTSFQVARLALVVTMSLPVWKLLQAAKRRFTPVTEV
jgi:uncharacterized protein